MKRRIGAVLFAFNAGGSAGSWFHSIHAGLAGYKPYQIGPMFRDCADNVVLPESFRDFA